MAGRESSGNLSGEQAGRSGKRGSRFKKRTWGTHVKPIPPKERGRHSIDLERTKNKAASSRPSAKLRINRTPKGRRKLERVVEKKNEKLRRRYRAVHGKVVDWVDHAFEDGDLFVSIRFQEKTDVGLVFRPKIVTDEISLYDVRTGNFRLVRQYFRGRRD